MGNPAPGERLLTQRAELVWHVDEADSAARALPPAPAALVELERTVRNRGLARVRLDCVAHATQLLRFYEARGYYPAGVRTAFGHQVLRLEKDLVAADDLARRFEQWQPELIGTLVFVVDADRVLLIHKKTGHGAGKINAPGGKLESGETAAQCAIRETFEEVGVRVERLRLMARLEFADTVASQWFGHVYVADQHRGTPVPTREADPHWYALDAVPYERMWQDDRIWLPLVLAGRRVTGQFLFDDGRLRAHRLRDLEG